MKLSIIAVTACLLPGVALAGGQHNPTGGNSSAQAVAGASASAGAIARVSSFNANSAVGYGGRANATGGQASAAGGAGGSAAGGSSNATVINSAGGGHSGSWWQGSSATVIPPAMVSNGTCSDSVSFGIAGGPGGFSFGFPKRNDDCNIREVAKTYLLAAATRGDRRAKANALAVLCLSPEAKQAGICK